MREKERERVVFIRFGNLKGFLGKKIFYVINAKAVYVAFFYWMVSESF